MALIASQSVQACDDPIGISTNAIGDLSMAFFLYAVAGFAFMRRVTFRL